MLVSMQVTVKEVYIVDCKICGFGIMNDETGDYMFRSELDASKARNQHIGEHRRDEI